MRKIDSWRFERSLFVRGEWEDYSGAPLQDQIVLEAGRQTQFDWGCGRSLQHFFLNCFPGQKEFDLCKIPKPCNDSDKCGTSRDPERKGEFINLFVQKSVQGWWACWKEGEEKPQVRTNCCFLRHQRAGCQLEPLEKTGRFLGNE